MSGYLLYLRQDSDVPTKNSINSSAFKLDRLGCDTRLVLTDAAQKLALDSRTCVQILREAGHLYTTSLSCVVDLGYIPNGLDAAELERYLREYGTRPGCA